jgi:hypothetical protein
MHGTASRENERWSGRGDDGDMLMPVANAHASAGAANDRCGGARLRRVVNLVGDEAFGNARASKPSSPQPAKWALNGMKCDAGNDAEYLAVSAHQPG